MITQEEYNKTYVRPFLTVLLNLIDKIKKVRKNMDLISWYPNTPHVDEGVDDKGRRYLKVTEFYDLKLDGRYSSDPTTISDALIELLDVHQESLKLRKPSNYFLRFKRFILALDHEVKIDYSMDTERIRENGFPYSKFSSHFSNLKKAISDIEVNQDTIFGTGEKEGEVFVEEEVTPTFEGMTSDQLDIIIKNNNVTSDFVSNMTLQKLLDYRGALFKAINLINASPFKKGLQGAKIYIGTTSALAKRGFPRSSSKVIAVFWHRQDVISYYVDKTGESKSEDKPAYITLIHELGHRYHYYFLKNKYYNGSINELYNEAIKPKDQCYLDHLPKLGDSLSDLRNDWWTVRMGSDDYTLSSISRSTYTYTNPNGDMKVLEKKDILKRITCPSQYSAKNREEFFAEMFTLIVLGLVKPNQRTIAEKFLQIVNQESL